MKWVGKLQKLGAKQAPNSGIDYSIKGDMSAFAYTDANGEMHFPTLQPLPEMKPLTIDTSAFSPDVQKQMLATIDKTAALPAVLIADDGSTVEWAPPKITLEQALDVLSTEVGISSIQTSFQQDAGCYPIMELVMKLSPAKAHVLGALHAWAIKQGGKSW